MILTSYTPFNITMEAEVIKCFLPDLVTAISDCVQPVSDQCLAKGLIPDSVYKRVLESGGTSEDKARTLILAVKKSTETDSGCLEILLKILEEQLPYAIKEKLLSEIRKELTEKANTCRAVVPPSQTARLMPTEELPRESVLHQSSSLGKFEDSVRQHERACAERSVLEEMLKVKSEEYESLKQELEALNSQTQEASSIQGSTANTQSKITDYEHEIETLKERVEKLKHTIEEQGMKVKRGRNTLALKTEKMLTMVAQQSQAETWEKAEEEMRIKERELVKTIQENTLRIKELELESKQYKESLISLNVVPLDALKEYHIGWLCANGLRDHKKSPYWRNLGSQLGFTTKELDEIDKHPDKDKLYKMLYQWVKWYPGDSRGSTNFATYTSLQTAFVMAGLGEVVHSLLNYNNLTTFILENQ